MEFLSALLYQQSFISNAHKLGKMALSVQSIAYLGKKIIKKGGEWEQVLVSISFFWIKA